MRLLRSTALPLTLGVFTLSACGLISGSSVAGEDLADAAADALEGQIGERPEVDCGNEDITAEVDKEVDCTAIDPATDEEVDLTVTFTSVDGQEWAIEVESKGVSGDSDESMDSGDTGEENSKDPGDSSEQPADSGGNTDSQAAGASALADAAEDALEAQYGARPEIDCGEVNYELRAGRIIYCDLTDPGSGEVYSTTLTITGSDGDQWLFDIEVSDTPK